MNSMVIVELIDGGVDEHEANTITEESGIIRVKDGRILKGVYQIGAVKSAVLREGGESND